MAQLENRTVIDIIAEGTKLWDEVKDTPCTGMRKFFAGNENHGLPDNELQNWKRQGELVEELDKRIDVLCDRHRVNMHYPFKGMTIKEVAEWFGIPESLIKDLQAQYQSNFTVGELRQKFVVKIGHSDIDHNRVIPTFRGSMVRCFSDLAKIAHYTAEKIALHRACQETKDMPDDLDYTKLHLSSIVIGLQGMSNGLHEDFEYQGM